MNSKIRIDNNNYEYELGVKMLRVKYKERVNFIPVEDWYGIPDFTEEELALKEIMNLYYVYSVEKFFNIYPTIVRKEQDYIIHNQPLNIKIITTTIENKYTCLCINNKYYIRCNKNIKEEMLEYYLHWFIVNVDYKDIDYITVIDGQPLVVLKKNYNLTNEYNELTLDINYEKNSAN